MLLFAIFITLLIFHILSPWIFCFCYFSNFAALLTRKRYAILSRFSRPGVDLCKMSVPPWNYAPWRNLNMSSPDLRMAVSIARAFAESDSAPADPVAPRSPMPCGIEVDVTPASPPALAARFPVFVVPIYYTNFHHKH